MANYQLLSKIAYGYSPEFWQRYKDMPWQRVLEEQLRPTGKEAGLEKRLAALRLPIKYKHQGKAVDEERPLRLIYQSQKELFQKLYNRETHRKEKLLAALELWATTLLRAQHSQWQLQELLVEFWHNHFNVYAIGSEAIALSLPEHDRRIRKHALGNFRQLLEAVAQSPAMLYYLHNYQSKASPANENYARELFELHTLGAEHYLNHLYNRWREVPGASEGKPIGYIDEDVYEAARAFTGWTVGDGRKLGKGENLPMTGEFLYYEGWHDHYQKRVLATEFAPHSAPEANGQQVLDLLAKHPATAKHICYKLCQRFHSDKPPESLVNRAVETWRKEREHPEQLALVVKTILLAPEFVEQPKTKTKRPMELLLSFSRALGMELLPNERLLHLQEQTGQAPFLWQSPTGHPDTEQHWLSDSLLLNRWNMLSTLLSHNWHQASSFDAQAQFTTEGKTVAEIMDFWLARFFPQGPEPELRRRVLALYAAGGDERDIPHARNEQELKHRFEQSLLLMALSPDFQRR